MQFAETLKGHGGWVTALSCPANSGTVKLISASRDKTLLTWSEGTNANECIPRRRLEGHSGFVQDVAMSTDGDYAVSASWDRSLRLWDLKSGQTMHKFRGHEKDVLSVAISPNNRQIASSGRDSKIKVWNVVGQCMHTMDKDTHTDWVCSVRFIPTPTGAPTIVSGSWDTTVKVWDLTSMACINTLKSHKAQVTCTTVSPDGSLFATASKDGIIKLWDQREKDPLYELMGDQPVNQICFSPNRYWLCAATQSAIRIYDLESKEPLAELVPERREKNKIAECTAIAWSADGNCLYSGYSDNIIRVWNVLH